MVQPLMLCEVLIYPHSTHICRYIQEEIYEGKEIWFFVPEDTRSSVLWYVASQILKEGGNE